jgi:pimeloyl-ACP methyl ester carboxylesterase
MNKRLKSQLIILLLIVLLVALAGCKKTDTTEQSNRTASLDGGNTATDKAPENSGSEAPQNTADQNNEAATSPDKSKEMDEFYQAWNQEQMKLDDNNFVNYYSLIREGSDTLLIYLEGSGCQSVMGVKGGGKWIRGGNPYSFAKKHFPDYDFLTLDNVNVKMGGDHFDNSTVINNYTFDNRVNSSVSVIDTFLSNSKKKYIKIILFGISQGGHILPRVYSHLKNKDTITRLIALGSGGLSQYEEFMILKDSELPMEPGYKEEYAAIEEAYPDILQNPDSVERQYFGYPYKMWYGFLKYHPMEDYININIPILLLHGAEDTNSPVETARVVVSEFQKAGKTNLKYIEYATMGHGPESKEQSDQLFNDIKSWLQ